MELRKKNNNNGILLIPVCWMAVITDKNKNSNDER